MSLALLAAPRAAVGDPTAYTALPIHGQVVDDVSGQPLAGVIVVAQWELVHEALPGLVNRDEGDRLKVVETITDRDGRYAITGWGPLPRPAFRHLEHRDPSIVFFSPGHYPWMVTNELRGSYSRDAVRKSQWDGQTVRLRAFTGRPQEWTVPDGRFRATTTVDGSIEDYATRLTALQVALRWTQPDARKRYPRMERALADERERLAAAGLDPNRQILKGFQP